MRHLVTGGSGFLGNLIARRLCERGETVRIIDLWEDMTRPPEIEYVECDVLDADGVGKAMRGIDVVHHVAGLNPVTKAGKRFWQVNAEGSRVVAEQATAVGVDAFVHMSSSAVFGRPREIPIRQETPVHPIEIYGKSKVAGETAVREICETSGLPLVVLRPRALLGEGRLGIFKILFDWICEGRRIYVIGNANNRFQFLHAHDLMDAYLLALDLQKPGTYNVGTDQFGTLREDLGDLIEHVGSSSTVCGVPAGLTIGTLRLLDWFGLSPLAPFHYLTYHKDYYFDVEPLLALGWKPKYSNQLMLRDTYNWYLENREQILADKEAYGHRTPAREKMLWLLRKIS